MHRGILRKDWGIPRKSRMKKTIRDAILRLPAAAGLWALFRILTDPSEEKNALIFGLSGSRLILAGAVLLFTVFSLLVYRFRKKGLRYLFFAGGACALLSGEILIFSRFPCDDTRNLIPLIADRAQPILLWMLFSAGVWFLALLLSGEEQPRGFGFFLLIFAVAVYWVISSHTEKYNWRVSLSGNTAFCLLTAGSALLWLLTLYSETERGIKTAAGCVFFMILGFSVTRLTGMWMGRVQTPPNAYWNELAESFISGRMDLPHPAGFHDLTFYDGKWYVPNPPLPGILLIPWVLILGSAGAVNMCIYDAVIAGINAGLFFLMLTLAFVRPHAPLYQPVDDDSVYPGHSLQIICWVTVLFVFGTDHLWLGTTGQMWFISQMLVVTFTLLACICVICSFSPVIAGIWLGLGVLCRPNIFPVFLCMLGIYLFRENDFPRFSLKKTFFWCLKCGIPVLLSAGLLLFYNKLRFDNWMDFGYVTINGADWILDSVQEYGMFHPHFFRTNASVMLWGLPGFDFSGERFFFQPHVAGYSVFLMTPPLIFIFRSFRRNWFAIGAWASVLLSSILLLLYHNTGAEQVGYRYLLDFCAPLALLTADGLRGKVGWLFKLLTVFAAVLSYIAIYWWYLGRV